MKNIALLLIMLCSFAHSQVHSQTRHKKRNTANLTITLSTDYYAHLLDSASLSKDTAHWQAHWKHNPSDNTIGYHFKNLSKGDYIFFAKDILGLRHRVTFRLTKDTVIKLDNHMGFHPVPVISKDDLQKGTPVYIVYLLNGCFMALQETVVITKDKSKDTYRLDFYSNMEKEKLFRSGIGPAILDDLAGLQTQSLVIKAANSPGGMSTTHRDMIIVSGNKLFHFSDDSNPFEWELFGEFVNKYLNQRFMR